MKEFSSFGSCERLGPRPRMEDALTTLPVLSTERIRSTLEIPKVLEEALQQQGESKGTKNGNGEKLIGCFAVYDGHGGRSSSSFCSVAVPYLLARDEDIYTDVGKALTKTFAACDKLLSKHLADEFSDSLEFSSGTTAVVAVLEYMKSTHKIEVSVGNVGDSRCVLVKKQGECKDLSTDHVPSLQYEKERIEGHGGFISTGKYGQTTDRVLGALAVTRALGDFDFKLPKVTAWGTTANPITGDLVSNEPELVRHTCGDDDLALILACDGIWNVFSSQEAADFVRDKLAQLKKILKKATNAAKCEVIATALVELAIERGSNDNCSCIVLLLAPEPASDNKSTLCTIS